MLIPSKIFTAGISKLCDTEASRYALGGVKIERDSEGRPHIVATDGRKLIECTWAEPDASDYPAGWALDHVSEYEAIIPKKNWEEAGKLPPVRTPKAILRYVVLEEPTTNGTVTLGATDLETDRRVTARQIEGRFPRWGDVFPHQQPHEQTTIAMDAGYVAEVCAILGKLADNGDGVPKIEINVPHDPSGAVVFRGRDAEGLRVQAVVMPIACEDKVVLKHLAGARDRFDAACCGADMATLIEQMAGVMTSAQLDYIASLYATEATPA